MSEGTEVDRAEKEWRKDAVGDQWIGEKSNGRGRSSNETAVVRKLGDGETKIKKSKTNSLLLLLQGEVLSGYWKIVNGWFTSWQ